MLQGCSVHGKFCGTAYEAGFEHEGEGVFKFDGFEICGTGAFEGFGVGAVAGHAVVQRCASGDEAFGFGVVLAPDETHEFVHEVAMEPWGAEGVFGDDPAGREDGEVGVGGARDFTG